ncbi:uncharacterized protein LOC128883074 isoform X2 [Hylaeus volcanicus]|uniref:uncharacterized protein LOC128883074 isoform X2 n=1 Tax=Hylaeus volcanicus TaxID=313075 RepID=UPI0023B80A82|nr:uncharacterized protein LOC128883074 isoform X2 [Hylaeus volcanicus]
MGNDISYNDIYEYGYYDSQHDAFSEQQEISVFFCSSDQCNLFFQRIVAYTERETETSSTIPPIDSRNSDIVIRNSEGTVNTDYTSRIYSWIQSAASLLIDLEGSFVVRRVRELASKQQVLQCLSKANNYAIKVQRSSTSLYIRSLAVQNKMGMLTSLKRSAGYPKCSLDELYCAICLEVFCRPVVTECWHIFCVDCIKSSLHRKNSCPLCRASIQSQSLQALDTVKKNHHIKRIQKQFLSLFVECPRCLWNGRMYEWNFHQTLCFRQETGNAQKNIKHFKCVSQA